MPTDDVGVGGCSSNCIEKLGMIHETFGSVPLRQSSR